MQNNLVMRVQLLLTVAFCVFTIPATAANDVSIGQITIVDAWARAAPTSSENGAAYFTITNSGEKMDRLLTVNSSISHMSQFHTHIMDNGVGKMRHVPNVELPPQETVKFKPGMGFHVMLMDLKESLDEGKSFSMILTLEYAGEIRVPVTVQRNPLE